MSFMESHFGLKVIQTPLALETTEEPVRVHIQSLGMSDSYHRRIQKKWIKRWGYVQKPCMFKTPNGIVCHPAIYRKLEREMIQRRPWMGLCV